MSEEPRVTRLYVAEVFGQTFLIEATGYPNVRGHLRKRLTRELKISLASAKEAYEAAKLDVPIEQANASDEDAEQGDLLGND